MTYYRRNLPHWHPEGKAIFITWRLFGSFSRNSCQNPESPRAATRDMPFLAADHHLDMARSGPVWLRDPEIAACAVRALHRGAELGHYELHAYVVMPNHVHVLLEPRVPLVQITRGIKGVAARGANVALGRVGKPFWQDESFDHWIRNGAEFEKIRDYIENNPVTARLVKRPQDWRWSSANKSLFP
jgi:REP element-mobilizing transposase RayT